MIGNFELQQNCQKLNEHEADSNTIFIISSILLFLDHFYFFIYCYSDEPSSLWGYKNSRPTSGDLAQSVASQNTKHFAVSNFLYSEVKIEEILSGTLKSFVSRYSKINLLNNVIDFIRKQVFGRGKDTCLSLV